MEYDAVCYFDGACGPVNPGGTVGWGYTIRDRNGDTIAEDFGSLPPSKDNSNNVAEYLAAAKAVVAYKRLNRPGPLVMKGDSQLVVKQMKGEWSAKQGSYMPVYRKLLEVLWTCTFPLEWTWIPREQNTHADALSKRALS